MKLEIDIEARFAQFTDSLNKIQRDTERVAAGISKSFHGIVPVLDVGRLIEQITEFGHAIAEKFTSQFEKADEFNKLSQKIGISVESLTALNFAAKLSDLSIEALTKGIKKLSTNLIEAQQGAGEGAKLFDALKLDPKQFDETDQLLLALADRFSKMPDGAGKAAIAVKAFGKSGLDLIPFLNQGAAGITKLTDEARSLGLVLSEDVAIAAEQFNDSLKRLHSQTEGIIRTFFSGIVPVLSDLAEKFYESGRAADSFKSELLKVAENRAGVLNFLEDVGTKAGFLVDQFRLFKVILTEVALIPLKRIGQNVLNAGKVMGIASSKLSSTDKNAAYAALETQASEEFAALDKRKASNRDAFNEPSALSKVQKFFDEQRRTARINGEKFIFDTKEQAQRVQKIYDEFFSTPEGRKARKRKGFTPDFDALVGGTNKGEIDQSAKRLLEQQLKDFEHTIDQEKVLASTRNDFLSRYFHDGLISLSDYTVGRKSILSESLRNETAAINGEIALLEKSKAGQKNSDKIQTQSKINDLVEKRTKLESESSVEANKLFEDAQKYAKDYARSLSDINIQLLEMQGNLGEAAKIRFTQQHAGERTRLETEVGDAQTRVDTTPEGPARDLAFNDLNKAVAAQQSLDALEKTAVAQGVVNRLEQLASRIREDASAAEERAHLAAQSGLTSELESLQAINDIRKQEVESLTGVAGLYDAIAKSSDDKRITQGAKAMRLEIDKLAASADLLRDKFQGVFTSAFGSFFDKITSHTASVKDAFKSLISDFTSQIAKLAQQNIIDQLFSKQGSAGGAPSFLAGLFGATSQSTAAPVTQGVASSSSGFFTQAAAPISQGVASSFASSAPSGDSTAAATAAAASLASVGEASTATTFALKEFSDDGLAKATGQLFENVAVSTVESTATQTATGSLASLTIAAEAAAAALASMATSAAVNSTVQSAAGGFAEGGLITGAGTGTSDSIPAMLSNNEFVVRAEPVKQPGALQFLHRFNQLGMAAVKIQHFATGGLVRSISDFASTYSTASPQMMAGVGGGGGHINLTQNFTVQPSTPRETQQQFAAAAFQGGARALRRNR